MFTVLFFRVRLKVKIVAMMVSDKIGKVNNMASNEINGFG